MSDAHHSHRGSGVPGKVISAVIVATVLIRVNSGPVVTASTALTTATTSVIAFVVVGGARSGPGDRDLLHRTAAGV
jgi:hypothetical protein